jgi:hypothetical protein
VESNRVGGEEVDVDVGMNVSQVEMDHGRIDDVTDELDIEYANPIPTDNDEEMEVVQSNGEIASEEVPPVDEVVQHEEEASHVNGVPNSEGSERIE